MQAKRHEPPLRHAVRDMNSINGNPTKAVLAFTSEGVFKLAPHDFLKILSKSKPLNYHLLMGFVQ